jgi:nucleotide-binding universal stress UspA family protein
VRSGSLALSILREADDMPAAAVVMGSRGLTGLGTLGSVSHSVLQHADRPVLVVPSPEAARERRERLHRG